MYRPSSQPLACQNLPITLSQLLQWERIFWYLNQACFSANKTDFFSYTPPVLKQHSFSSLKIIKRVGKIHKTMEVHTSFFSLAFTTLLSLLLKTLLVKWAKLDNTVQQKPHQVHVRFLLQMSFLRTLLPMLKLFPPLLCFCITAHFCWLN